VVFTARRADETTRVRAVAEQGVSSGRNQLGFGDGQRLRELSSGADAELGEDLAQMPLHGARAEEEPGADLGVGEPVAGQLGDLALLRGQIVARLDSSLADPLARRLQLSEGALGERLHPDRVNWSWAARSWARASTRRCARRNHSP
jgi:hypothetical protein